MRWTQFATSAFCIIENKGLLLNQWWLQNLISKIASEYYRNFSSRGQKVAKQIYGNVPGGRTCLFCEFSPEDSQLLVNTKKWISCWIWWARAKLFLNPVRTIFSLGNSCCVGFIYLSNHHRHMVRERRLGQPDISFALFISAFAGFSAHNFFILITCCAKGAFYSTDLMALPCATNLSKSHAVRGGWNIYGLVLQHKIFVSTPLQTYFLRRPVF